MENNKNMTAIDYIVNVVNSCIAPDYIPNEIVMQAKQMEKEQMIEFTDKVLDNTIGDLILLYPVEKIYNETYGKENSN